MKVYRVNWWVLAPNGFMQGTLQGQQSHLINSSKFFKNEDKAKDFVDTLKNAAVLMGITHSFNASIGVEEVNE